MDMTPVTNPPLPTEPPMMAAPPPPISNSSKHLWLLSGLAILVLGILLGAFGVNVLNQTAIKSSPTPTPVSTTSFDSLNQSTISQAPPGDPTANWKTYTNSRYSFKYPQAWETQSIPNGTQQVVSVLSPDKFMSLSLSLDLQGLGYECVTKTKEETITIDAQKVTKTTFTGAINDMCGDNTKQREVWISILRDNKIDNLTFSTDEENFDKAMGIFNQILSTFKFTGTTPTVTPATNKNVTNFYYKLPDGWKTVQDETGSFEVGYDPNVTTTSLTYSPDAISIFIKGNIGGAAMSVHLKNYDGGSRHQFIYKFTSDNQPPQKQDLGSDYNEKEYFYNNKSCLFLRGIYTSQFPNVWGMCDAGSGKAFLITSYVPDYETTLQTIRLLK